MRSIVLLSNLSSGGHTLCIREEDFRGLYFYKEVEVGEIRITNNFSNYNYGWACGESMIRRLIDEQNSI
jgi:hypothetical protein